MIELFWWHWALAGLGLVLAELMIPSFVIVWFGLGALLVMAALLVAPALSLTAQIALWTASSILMTILWFRVLRPRQREALVGRASAQLVGEIGMVVEPIAPFKKGKVRFQRPLVGSDLWEAAAEKDIAPGARVRVAGVEGNIVTVTPVEEPIP